jgi:protein gp37
MGETTGISWTDSTFNPWIGCTKVGPGCDNCYAEAQDKRFGGAHWGVGAERKRTTPVYWKNLRKWNAKAPAFIAEHGRKQRVFIASQADVFDNAVPLEWRDDLWSELRACPDLEIIIVTKRVGNVKKGSHWDMAPGDNFRPNVILLATVCNQAEADRDVPKLLALKGAGVVSRIGLSIEPMLGPMDVSGYLPDLDCGPGLDWVIAGGESGPAARPSHPDWFRSLRDQCAAAGVPFFFKQWGEWMPVTLSETGAVDPPFPVSAFGTMRRWDGFSFRAYGFRETVAAFMAPGQAVVRVGKRRAGSLLDGVQHKEFPQ